MSLDSKANRYSTWDTVGTSKHSQNNMRSIKSILNRPIDRNFAATLIVVVSLVLPAYGLYNLDWENAEFGILSVLLPLLYAMFVTGLVFLSLGKKGRSFTSAETDKKIAVACSYIRKRLAPLWWVLGGVWLAWVVYLVWKLK